MPAQKRSLGSPAHSNEEENINSSSAQEIQMIENIQSDSPESPASSIGDEDEYITVTLPDLRKEVQCPICLGIIRKTRTVMECLHRFCRECIDKSMRLGNNECPACRTHCASRRSLRDDPNFDTLISVLYPDIDKYEEEELAFYEAERTRFKQIQASIAQTLHRQSEALARKRPSGKTTAAASARTSDRSSRGRRNQRAVEQQGSDEQDGANGHDRAKDSSSADEPVTEVQPKRCKRWTASRFSQTSLGAGSADGDGDYTDTNRDSLGASAGLVEHSELLTWGRGGIRSNTRHSSLSAGNAKNARNMRMSKLFDSFQNTVKVDGMDIHLILVPLDEQRIPSLENPHIRCSPTVSVRYLCQHVGSKTTVSADEVEILLVKGLHSIPNLTVNPSTFVPERSIDPCRDELHILEEHETLAELLALYNVNRRSLLFAYRQKLSASVNLV